MQNKMSAVKKFHESFKIGNWDHELVEFDLPFIHGDKETILRDALDSTTKLGFDFDDVLTNTITSYNPDSDGRQHYTQEEIEDAENIYYNPVRSSEM